MDIKFCAYRAKYSSLFFSFIERFLELSIVDLHTKVYTYDTIYCLVLQANVLPKSDPLTSVVYPQGNTSGWFGTLDSISVSRSTLEACELHRIDSFHTPLLTILNYVALILQETNYYDNL